MDSVGAELAAEQGASPPAPDHAFDATLRSRVAAFQQTQGLTPDGVAGPTTLMQINRASGVAEPWLAGMGPPAAAAAAQRKQRMSYILDALRRADAERSRGAVPGLHAQGVPTDGSRRRATTGR